MNKNNLVIVGYSGHGLVISEIAVLNDFSVLGYTDQSEKRLNPFNFQYLGSQSDFFKENKTQIQAVIAVGDNKIRKDIAEEINSKTVQFPALIHPNASFSTFSEINEGTVVMRMASVNPNAKIGRFCIINTSTVVDHDAVIGDFVHIAAGAVILGGGQIENGVYIGGNSVIRQNVKLE